MDPNGRTALVTGGASGIGLAYARELLLNGANVAICDVNAKIAKKSMEDITETFGEGRAIFIEMDVTNETAFEEALKTTKNNFNSLDIVINNAGVFDEVHWERLVDINLKGVVRGTLLALKYLGKDNGGNGGIIVNAASIFGLECNASSPVYCAAKHGVVALSRCLGMPFHYARTGVRIVTLCPSATVTPLMEAHRNSMSRDCDKVLRDALESYPTVTPDVVARSLLHLIREADTGSVWVTEGEETYPVEIPDRQTFRAKHYIVT